MGAEGNWGGIVRPGVGIGRSSAPGKPMMAGLGAIVSLAACSAPLAGPGGIDAAEGASSAALVVIERTVGADDTTHGSAVARFVRMRSGSVDDDALRMIGATLDLPPIGSCARPETTADDSSLGPRGIELLDVGTVAVEGNGTKTSLEARSLPDISDLVTGVLYATRTSAIEADAFPSRGGYTISSTGSRDRTVPPFSLSATAPGEPEGLRIDGQDAQSHDGVTLRTGYAVELHWAVSDADDPDDSVYVELVAPSDAREAASPTVRCLFANRGVASIPSSAFFAGTVAGASAARAVEMDHGTLVVHRLHHETFQLGTSGIDSGVIRFDFARSAEFTRR